MSRTTEQITLGYWAIHGLGHPIRFVLHYTKTPFTDKMYQRGGPPDFSPEVWLCEKEKLGLDFPNLPYLFDNDLKITQSKAILYYLGRKFHLIGTTPEQEAHVMMLCEEIHDLRLKGLDMYLLLDYEKLLLQTYSNVKRYVEEFISKFPELKVYIEKANREIPLNAPQARFGAKVIERK